MPMVFGVTSTGLMVPILVDTVGKLQVSVFSALPAGTNRIGAVGTEGWISSAWQKNPLRFGFSGLVSRLISSTTLAAGTNNLDDSAVPAGEFWVITNIAVDYVGTVANVGVRARIVDGVNSPYLFEYNPTVSDHLGDRQGFWIVPSGANLRLTVIGATLNDDAYLWANGFRVDTDQ